MDQTWRPFRVRVLGEVDDYGTLVEGVPPYLLSTLEGWIYPLLQKSGALCLRMERSLRMPLNAPDDTVYTLQRLAREGSPDVLLDVIDFLLTVTREQRDYAASVARSYPGDIRAVELARALEQAGSAYTVQPDEWALVRRVDKTVEATAQEVIASSGEAGKLLRTAWVAAYGRDPHPNEAYRAAVLAVESVATHVFTPNDTQPSLGKAIAHLKQTLSTWTVADMEGRNVASSGTLLSMLQLLWQNQSRHVKQGGDSPKDVTQQEAEAAVAFAVTLVQLFTSGLIWTI